MGKYSQLAKEIIANVGGKENIISLEHCVTRLRFQLKDEAKAKDGILKNMDGVITVMKAAGQYQVVIGNHVPEVYDDVCEAADIHVSEENRQKKKMTIGNKLMDFISGIMLPSIAILSACGIIKGVNSIILFTGLLSDTDGLYMLLNAIGDSMFYFFPAVLGYNVAKKLKMNPYTGLVIGLSICYPAITGVDMNLFGTTINVSYTNTMLPVILMMLIAAPLERFFNKVIPDVIKTFITPALVLIITVVLGFVVIGPAANYVSSLFSNMVLNIYGISPILAGIVLGGLYQVLVVFGVHIIIVLTCIMNVMSGVPDPISPLNLGVGFAQTAVVFAIWLKTKDKKLKSIAFPAWISGIFGVTEPAIYGVTLPRIKMFVISCIGGAVSGMFAGLFGMRMYQLAGMGIFTIPAYINPDDAGKSLMNSFIVIAIAVVVSFLLAFILYKDDEDKETGNEEIRNKKQADKEIISSPMKGKVIPLKEVKDDAFAAEIMGKGIAIEPTEGKVISPFDGTIITLFHTKHAIGIISESGCEILIHLGMNTVKLDGKYFTAHVEQGQKVKKGDTLITFDLKAITGEGYSMQSPIIVTNTNDYLDVVGIKEKSIKYDEELLTVFI